MATKPFFPTKWWQWAIVPVLVFPVVAILTPVCAYSGPGAGGIVKSIAYRRRDEGAWPTSYRDPDQRFDYVLKRAEKGGAVYRVHAGCEREEWWVAERGAGTPPAVGNPRASSHPIPDVRP